MEGPGAGSTLQPEEVDLFRHNGFVKLPTRLSADLVQRLKAAALEDIRNEVEPVARRDGEVDRISGLWDRGGVFQEAIACDEILGPLESLLGPNIEFMLNRHNHIYLRDRKSLASIELHRDCRVWFAEPALGAGLSRRHPPREWLYLRGPGFSSPADAFQLRLHPGTKGTLRDRLVPSDPATDARRAGCSPWMDCSCTRRAGTGPTARA